MHWEKEESRLAEQELGCNRGTIRKGQRELESGIICLDAYSLRGRKPSRRASAQLAASDITAIVDGQSQADPQCGHESSLHAPDGNRSAPPVDRALWLS
jgi:hypothetical protein